MTSDKISPSRAGAVEWITFDCYGTLIDWEGGVAGALAPFLPSTAARASRRRTSASRSSFARAAHRCSSS